MNSIKRIVIFLIFVQPLLTGGLSQGQQAALPNAPASQEPDAHRSVSSVVETEVERSIAKVEPLLQRYCYAASFVAVMGEGIGIPLPGGTLLIASALDSAKGGMNIGVLLVVVTLAAWLGNSIGYLIGRWGGRTLLEKLRVNPHYLKRVEGLFDRRGGVIILIARFVDGLRQLNGIVAGILEMPWWTFTL